jgi:dienelactone hydrolase
MLPRYRLFALAVIAYGLGCVQPTRLSRDDSGIILSRQALSAPNPGAAGRYGVRQLYYGSGSDIRRPYFKDSVTIKTATVDGSKMVSTEDKTRKKYWGFGFDKMPINARVWYPDGEGPFPLVLIVHGNHNMKEFSDPGYAYLGELLASRGFIMASVDENFLNGNTRNENDARGWMLLKHLEAWRAFNDSSGRPFYHKVDTTRIALMGHSRGGEAVAVAAAFNKLPYYPDDAKLQFKFNFGIRSLVAIAPIDGQYRPTGRPTPLENVSYLVIHGSHDGDVSAFSGLAQWQRIKFTDSRPRFKSAIWMYRANHGQWNTVWNNKDNGQRSERWLNLDQLISADEQRQFGKVIMGAFLEATLRDRTEYLPIFRDHRVIGSWLPKTMYTTRFEESGLRALARFEEDVDVTTGSVAGVTLKGDSLSTWKEAPVPLRWRNTNVGHNAVWLGWNNRVAGDDTTKRGQPALFSMTLTDSLRGAWSLDTTQAIVLSLAPTPDTPGPRAAPKDSSKADSTKKVAAAKSKKPPIKVKPDSTPFDLTLEVVDDAGNSARVPLSAYGPVRRPLDIYVGRRKGRDKANYATTYEIVLQTYVVPLADFVRARPGFETARLKTIRLVFDRTVAGTIVLSDIGLSKIDRGFLTLSAASGR